jgi:hypothetical protein
MTNDENQTLFQQIMSLNLKYTPVSIVCERGSMQFFYNNSPHYRIFYSPPGFSGLTPK